MLLKVSGVRTINTPHTLYLVDMARAITVVSQPGCFFYIIRIAVVWWPITGELFESLFLLVWGIFGVSITPLQLHLSLQISCWLPLQPHEGKPRSSTRTDVTDE